MYMTSCGASLNLAENDVGGNRLFPSKPTTSITRGHSRSRDTTHNISSKLNNAFSLNV